MIKIKESEKFHPRRKMTSSRKIVAFFEKNFFAYIKFRKVRKVSRS